MITLLAYGVIGIMYFYRGPLIPFELTSDGLWFFLILSFLFTPVAVGLVLSKILPEKYQENKSLGCLIHILLFGYVVHNLIWTLFIFAFRGPYEDMQVYYPDLEDKRRQVITQYKDQGAIGSHYRTIKVYELTPFLRYIESVDYR